MPPMGECSHCVIDGSDTKTQQKTQLLARDYNTFYLAKVVIFVTQNRPPTQEIDATSGVQM